MKYYRNISKLILTSLILLFITAQPSISLELEGIKVPETVQANKNQLILNGVGIRTKFFFNIYVGSLYLNKKETNINQILDSHHAKRIHLHFLYKAIPKEKLVLGWTAGFKNNNSEATFKLIKDRVDQFNSYIDTTHKGDTLQFDFLSNNNTKITFNNQYKGEINGNDFQVALLKIWLGDDPADYALQEALLGITDD